MNNFDIKHVNRVIVYARVSTRKQASNGKNGLSIQRDICKDYCNKVLKKRDYDYYEDIGTTYRGKNILENQNKMVRRIDCPDTIIIIHSVSRLGRDLEQTVKFLTSLKKKGVIIISVSDNSCYGKTRLLDKKFYYRMIFAEEKSDLKSEKMSTRNRMIIQMGGYVGRAPYGYCKNKINGVPMLVKDKEEQTVMKTIITLRKKRKNDVQIAQYLQKKNLTKRGFLWSKYTIRSIQFDRKIQTYRQVNDDLLSSFERMEV